MFCITSILYFWGIHEELPPYAWKKCAWGKADIPPVTEWQTNISNSWTMNSVPGPAAIGTCNRYNVVAFLFPDIYIYNDIYNIYIYISYVLCPLQCSVNVPPRVYCPAATILAMPLTMHTRWQQDCTDSAEGLEGSLRWRRKLENFSIKWPVKAWCGQCRVRRFYHPKYPNEAQSYRNGPSNGVR